MNRRLVSNGRIVALGIALAAVTALFAPTTADAMGGAPCDDPFLFRQAAINAVVLPFRTSGQDVGGELSDTGRSLATLVQLEVLLSLIKYQSVGAVVLRENEREGCDAVEILIRLSEQITPGHGLILIWGRLFEQQDQIYVQTYARFMRGERTEGLKFTLTGRDDVQFDFEAPMPSTSLAFAPRRLSRADIDQIETEFREATVVRPRRDPEATGEILHQNPDQPFAYTVTQVRDGWMHVVERGGTQRGWIQARDESDWSLRRKMPELALIDAIAGYLRLLVGGEGDVSLAPSSTAASVRRAIKTYRRYAGKGDAEAAESTASVLQGMVALTSTPSLESAIAEVSEQFSLAMQQAPSDTAARNLAAMPPILRYGLLDDNPESAQEAVRTMHAALALDPENGQALANLETFYDYLRHRPTDSPAYPPADLERRWLQVKAIRGNAE